MAVPQENPLVHIEKLVHGGRGLGRLGSGKVVLVAGALPGERVRIAVQQEARGHAEAVVREIVAAAAERVRPACPHYPNCGGCDLQHAAYAAQLRLKTGIVQESLQRAGVTPPAETGVLASPLPYGYRSRLRLHLSRQGLGFYRRQSNTLVPVNRCLLASEGINTALAKIAADPDFIHLLVQVVTEVELDECPQTGRVFLVLATKKALMPALRERLARCAAQARFVDCLCTAQGQILFPFSTAEALPTLCQPFRLGPEPRDALSGEASRQHSPRLPLAGLAYALRWQAGSFFQANARHNANLVVLALTAAAQPKRALDLFCGAGNFSIPLALNGAEVLGVESSPAGIHWARRNAVANGLDARKASFIMADAGRALDRLVRAGRRFDLVLLDPPRQGLGRAAAHVPKLLPKRIVSISCDPATHARDLQIMCAAGCRLEQLTVMDMFPQTHHIESLALLSL